MSYGTGKTSFLKYYLDQTNSTFILFGRSETEFPDNYVPELQFEKREIESLLNETIVLDDASAYRNLQTKVDE